MGRRAGGRLVVLQSPFTLLPSVVSNLVQPRPCVDGEQGRMKRRRRTCEKLYETIHFGTRHS